MTRQTADLGGRGERPTFDYIVIGAGPAGCAVAARLAQSSADDERRARRSGTGQGFDAVRHSARHRCACAVTLAAQLRLRDRPAGGVRRAQGLSAARPGPRRQQPHQRDDLHARPAAGLRRLGGARLQGLGLDGRAALLQALGRQRARRGRAGTAPAGRSTSAISAIAIRPSRPSSRRPCRRDFRAMPISTARPRRASGPYQVFQKNGRRYNAARAYLQAAPAPNLAIFSEAQARRIVFDGQRAVGVVVRRGGAEERLYARREIIVSGGAFGSPATPDGLGRRTGRASEGVRDRGRRATRPRSAPICRTIATTSPICAPRGRACSGSRCRCCCAASGELSEFLRHGRGLLTSNAAEAGGFIRSRPDLDRPDLQLHFCIGIVDDHHRKLHFATGMSLHVCGLRPKSRGSVRLAEPGHRRRRRSSIRTSCPIRTISRRSFAAPKSFRPSWPSRRSRATAASTSTAPAATTRRRCARSSATTPTRSITRSAPAAWAWTSARSSIRRSGCAGSRACAWPTLRSCRSSSAATRRRPRP